MSVIAPPQTHYGPQPTSERFRAQTDSSSEDLATTESSDATSPTRSHELSSPQSPPANPRTFRSSTLDCEQHDSTPRSSYEGAKFATFKPKASPRLHRHARLQDLAGASRTLGRNSIHKSVCEQLSTSTGNLTDFHIDFTTPKSSKYRVVATRVVPPPEVPAPADHMDPSSAHNTNTKNMNLTRLELDPHELMGVAGKRQQLQQAVDLAPSAIETGGRRGSRSNNAGRRDPNSSDAVKVVAVRAPVAPKEPPFMFAGIVASLFGSLVFSLSLLCIKMLPTSDDAVVEKFKALFFRGLFVAGLSASSLLISGSTFRVDKDETWVNLVRSSTGMLAVSCSYFSLEFINMGDSTALIFSSPIWTYIMSHFIFHEPLSWVLLVTLPASIFGIVLIAHPTLVIHPQHLMLVHQLYTNSSGSMESVAANATHGGHLDADALRWPGVVIALVGSLFVSINYIVLKFRKRTPIQTINFWLGVTISVSCFLIMCVVGFGSVPDTLYEWSLLFGNGLCSWLGQWSVQWAMQYEQPGVLAIMRTSDVAVCFIISAIILDEQVFWTSVLGSLIIGLVVVSIIANTWLHKVCPGPSQPEMHADAAVEAKLDEPPRRQ